MDMGCMDMGCMDMYGMYGYVWYVWMSLDGTFQITGSLI